MQTFMAFGELFVFLILLVVGYVAGRIAETRHYASIRKREKMFEQITVFTSRFPPAVAQPFDAALVTGSVVVSQDYFKAVVASLYSIVGGRVRSYESLLDRARRESVLRMKHAAMRKGASMIINVKFQTVAVPGRGVGAVELLAYGTALRPVGANARARSGSNGSLGSNGSNGVNAANGANAANAAKGVARAAVA